MPAPAHWWTRTSPRSAFRRSRLMWMLTSRVPGSIRGRICRSISPIISSASPRSCRASPAACATAPRPAPLPPPKPNWWARSPQRPGSSRRLPAHEDVRARARRRRRALVGAAYAAGMRGKDIRRHVIALAHNRGEITRRLIAARAGTLADLFTGAFGQATQLDAEKFCAQFLPEAVPQDFAALQIPLTVIATDLHKRQEAAFTSGPLRPALASSIAIPGLFRPVAIGSSILVDGGATNPLPFDQVRERADVTIAIDVF